MQAQSFLSVLHRFDVLFLLSICPALGVPDHSRAIILAISKNLPVSLVVFLRLLFGLLFSVVLPLSLFHRPNGQSLHRRPISSISHCCCPFDRTAIFRARKHAARCLRLVTSAHYLKCKFILLCLCAIHRSRPHRGCSFAAHSHALALFICLFMCLI